VLSRLEIALGLIPMPSINVLLPFLVTTAIFAFIPGPAMLYAAAQTLSGGRPAGLMAALGIHIGCYAHIITAAAGLSVLFHAVPTLYLAVKLAGAAYLIWLGVSLFCSSGPTVAGEIQSTPKAGRRAFFERITVEVLNPKTAIFFLAFLPQFVDATATFPVWLQLAILGFAVNAMVTLADVVCVLFAEFIISRTMKTAGAQR
jgi:threonine/homoserine/homoserine lactone efflux protein